MSWISHARRRRKRRRAASATLRFRPVVPSAYRRLRLRSAPLLLKGRREPVKVFFDRKAVLPLARTRSRVVRRSRAPKTRFQSDALRDWLHYDILRRSAFGARVLSKAQECSALKRRKEVARRAERHQVMRAKIKGKSIGPRGPAKPVTRRFRQRNC